MEGRLTTAPARQASGRTTLRLTEPVGRTIVAPAMSAKLPAAGDERTFYVVDVSGYLFRAFHAIPQLNNPRGEPTNA